MNDPVKDIDTLVLGASGYVAGECLRLVAEHPHLRLLAAISESQPGAPIGERFPHLRASFDDSFRSPDELSAILEESGPTLAVLSAGSHGRSAANVRAVLETAAEKDIEARVVDMSADFRYADPSSFEEVYGSPHGAPELLPEFVRGVPEHVSEAGRHAGHPGCFTTSVLLAIVPLLELGMIDPEVYAFGITGSTGAGREPRPTTHHPERHSNLFAYQALEHRHVPEMVSLAEAACGVRPRIHFVPHSGPFSRGIHSTLQARLRARLDENEIRSELSRFYERSPFVRVVSGTPRVKDVAGSNYAHLGVASDGDTVAVFSVIDNLVKGAAGGAVQWMNRLLGFPESSGLTAPAPGWI